MIKNKSKINWKNQVRTAKYKYRISLRVLDTQIITKTGTNHRAPKESGKTVNIFKSQNIQ